MKVATPDWLVKSSEAGVLLPWHEFKYKPTEKAEEAQGKDAGQQSLFEGFMSQQSTRLRASVRAPPISAVGQQHDIPQSQPERPPDHPTAGPSTPKRSRLAGTHAPDKSHRTEQPTAGLSTPCKSPFPPSKSVTTPTRPHYGTDPTTPEQAARVPGYAADKSNFAAERAMADPTWRAAHTSAAPDFIEGYYRNSRLHHLSTWKAELRNLVIEAQERAESAAQASSQNGGATGTSTAGACRKSYRRIWKGRTGRRRHREMT